MTPSKVIRKLSILACTIFLVILPALCSDDSAPTNLDITQYDRAARMERYMMLTPPSLSAEVALAPLPEFMALPEGPAPTLAVAPVVAVRNESHPILPNKQFFTLAALAHAGAAFDSWSTLRLVDRGGQEANPLVKPFADSAAIYPVMQLWPVAIDYVAMKMARSEKSWVRRMWWLPQTLSAAASFTNGFRNIALGNALPQQ